MDVHKLLENIYNELKKIFSNQETIEGKKNKNKLPSILIGCLSVILVCILIVLSTDILKSTSTTKISNQAKQVQDNTQISTSSYDYEVSLETELKTLLENIDGVGRVKVMINIDGSEEQVPALNITDSKSNTKERDTSGGTRDTTQDNNGSSVVVTNDGSKSLPLIIKTNKPKVIGVVVVADGAKEKVIQLEISQAVTRLFNISAEKVSVYPMKK